MAIVTSPKRIKKVRDESGTTTHKHCPVCGGDLRSYTGRCEKCWVDGNFALWTLGLHLAQRKRPAIDT